jgi:LysR family cys regulon transcriptional activator
MNLQQFRFVAEAARRNLNLTETAKALHTSQPGVSKGILELEEELGIDIFSRHGKRLRRITEPGQAVLASIDVILREVANLRRIGEEFSRQDSGRFSIATTHTQARYVLPPALAKLRQQYPKLQLSLHQGNPRQVAQMLIDETAIVGLATESLDEFDELVSLPWYEWQHVLVMPREHPLASHNLISLEQLANWPLISYHPAFTGRSRIDRAFAARQLQPQVVLEAIDADVIKTYVRTGLGLGLVAEMAVRDEGPNSDLVWTPVGHLFGANMARIAFKRGVYLRNHVLAFAELLSDRLSAPLLRRALAGVASSDEGL